MTYVGEQPPNQQLTSHRKRKAEDNEIMHQSAE